jgi:hypothetical protein
MMEKGVCTRNNGNTGGGGGGTTIIIKNKAVAISKTTINNKVTNVFKSFTTALLAGKQPSFLLLLNTAQLCQLAGDKQCVTEQNQFNTLNLVTSLSGGSRTVNGQVENRASSEQKNVQIIAHFYDSKGNNVGGLATAKVSPTSLKHLQLGVFNIKASTSKMSGPASFVRLEYSSSSSS